LPYTEHKYKARNKLQFSNRYRKFSAEFGQTVADFVQRNLRLLKIPIPPIVFKMGFLF